jgi:Pectate lyase
VPGGRRCHNPRFTDAADDPISVTNSAHRVWIDHCDLSAGYDGLLDIKRKSDYVTASWNHSRWTPRTVTAGARCRPGVRPVGRTAAYGTPICVPKCGSARPTL